MLYRVKKMEYYQDDHAIKLTARRNKELER
jgi:hypothetical protein